MREAVLKTVLGFILTIVFALIAGVVGRLVAWPTGRDIERDQSVLRYRSTVVGAVVLVSVLSVGGLLRLR